MKSTLAYSLGWIVSAIVVNTVLVAVLLFGWNYGVRVYMPQAGEATVVSTIMCILFMAAFDGMRRNRYGG
jgi:hypothetical protein